MPGWALPREQREFWARLYVACTLSKALLGLASGALVAPRPGSVGAGRRAEGGAMGTGLHLVILQNLHGAFNHFSLFHCQDNTEK